MRSAVCCFLIMTGVARSAPEFERDVLPILTSQCLNCQGGLKQNNGLDLRTIETMMKGGTSGPAVAPGDVEKSLLWKKVSTDEMPKALLKLSANEKRVLKEWIVAGMPRSKQWQNVELPPKPDGAAKVAEAIDREIERRLSATKIEPSPLSDDAEFLRRLHLDLIGKLPTPERVRDFLASKDPDKRAKLIDELLARPEYGTNFALRWHHRLTPLVDGKRVYDQALMYWLAKSFNDGRKWGDIVSDLVIAEGESVKNPAVGFLAAQKDPDKMGAKTAIVFLGLDMECAECHNHPLTRWRQKEDYWALAAFFGNVKASAKDGKATLTESTSKGKGGLQIRLPSTTLAAANATVPGGFPGVETKEPLQAPYRKALAGWMTSPENPYFAAAAANRWWAHFFGRGLVNPIGNLHDGNPPTHPAILALLAREFNASGHDIKHLIRCLCLTRAYQRTSRSLSDDEEPETLYARMPERLIGPDTLYDLFTQVLEVPDLTLPLSDTAPKPKKGPGTPPRQLFVNTFKQADDIDPREYDHGVLQVLQLVNWKDFNGGGKVVARLVEAKLPPEKVIEELYLRTLSRMPTAKEKEKVLVYVSKQGDAQRAWASVLWLLMNGSGFVFNQ